MNYIVGEKIGKCKVTIVNKKKADCKVRVATIDGDACAEIDYVRLDAVVEFKFY